MASEEVLKLLMVEDSEDDEALLLAALRRAGIATTHHRVLTEADLRAALRDEPWDLVLSDFSLPSFDAHTVLAAVRELTTDTPAIVVSGTLAEEDAVSVMRAGAKDFVAKERLARLGPAVVREVKEARLRSEQRAMREQLLMHDRMASVGLLAASVAHEIANPVNVLGITVELLQLELRNVDLRPKVRAILDDAGEAVQRVGQIARDITTFARADSDVTSAPVELPTVIASSLRMARHHISARATLEEDLQDVPRVLGSEGRLGQLFLNLLINAAQAIPEGKPRENAIRVRVKPLESELVEASVSDTGCGIPQANLAKIFAPFFTTKARGVGTGLGLPICKRIVDEIGGEMLVESQVGRGTTFRVRLPVWRRAQPRSVSRSAWA